MVRNKSQIIFKLYTNALKRNKKVGFNLYYTRRIPLFLFLYTLLSFSTGRRGPTKYTHVFTL